MAAKPRTAPQLLKVAEAAARLSCEPDTVYRLIADGDLVAVDIRRGGSGQRRPHWRVREDQLAALIDQRTVAS